MTSVIPRSASAERRSQSPLTQSKLAALEAAAQALAHNNTAAAVAVPVTAAVATTTGATVPSAATTGTTSASKASGSHINVQNPAEHNALIQLLGCVLTQLVAFEEASHPGGRGSISMFHTAYVPSISISAYLRRVALYAKVSSEVLLQAVLHVHQLMQRPVAPLVVNRLNVHRLLLTAIMATAKFFDDAHYNNAYFSYVGGVPLRELNALEVEFLSLLNFEFLVPTETFQYFHAMVADRNIHQQGCSCASALKIVPRQVVLDEHHPGAMVDEDFSAWVPHGPEVVQQPIPIVRPTSADVCMAGTSPRASATMVLLRAPSCSPFSEADSSSSASSSSAESAAMQPSATSAVLCTPPSAACGAQQEDAEMSVPTSEMGCVRIESKASASAFSGMDDAAAVAAATLAARELLQSLSSPAAPSTPLASRTPKKHSALHGALLHAQVVSTDAHTPLQHHRSASPQSYMSSSLASSPVSSSGSYSSLSHSLSTSSSVSFLSAKMHGLTAASQHGAHSVSSLHHTHEHSPSLSACSSTASFARCSSTGTATATPRQDAHDGFTAPSTPLQQSSSTRRMREHARLNLTPRRVVSHQQ